MESSISIIVHFVNLFSISQQVFHLPQVPPPCSIVKTALALSTKLDGRHLLRGIVRFARSTVAPKDHFASAVRLRKTQHKDFSETGFRSRKEDGKLATAAAVEEAEALESFSRSKSESLIGKAASV